MNTFALSNGLRRLFSFSVVLVVALATLAMSGCGHRCRCNSCHNQPASCSTCSTCGVSDNAPVSNTTCTTCQSCQTGSYNTSSANSYDRVGMAPASLSETTITQAPQPTYASQPAYSTGSNYASTSTSLQRPGESQELPLFSKPLAQAQPVQVSEQPSSRAFIQPVQQPAAVILRDAPAQGGNGQYHTLEKGETVYALSRKFGVKAKVILEANHFNDPNHLSVGTKVFIPAN